MGDGWRCSSWVVGWGPLVDMGGQAEALPGVALVSPRLPEVLTPLTTQFPGLASGDRGPWWQEDAGVCFFR